MPGESEHIYLIINQLDLLLGELLSLNRLEHRTASMAWAAEVGQHPATALDCHLDEKR